MNEYDSARMADVLVTSAGYEPRTIGAPPTCSDEHLLGTREGAGQVYSLLGEWRAHKQRHPG